MNSSSGPEFLIENYIYPIFLAETKEHLIYHMTYVKLFYAFLVTLMSKPAPYGRHATEKKIYISARLAWFIQESPSFFVPLSLVYFGSRNEAFKSIANKICLGMFMLHYFQRSFIFAALMKTDNKVPFMPFISAFMTTTFNGILHGYYYVSFHSYIDSDWLTKPYFWLGLVIFLYGMSINIQSDSILRNLRKGNSKEYKIPIGALFDKVSCPNYFGEIVEMWGYTLASCSPPAFSLAFFTTVFLTKRAMQHHQWYLKKFENYPKNRKAIIPFLL